MDRKKTAWKKSRKFGDIYGGRRLPKLTDGLLKRVHSLETPSPTDSSPLLRRDNPSRDFFFPLNAEEILRELRRLPAENIAGITHIWLRRVKKSDYEKGEMSFAEFLCGSGVRAVVLYPWPRDMKLKLGTKKPGPRLLKMYQPYSGDLVETAEGWSLEFQLPALQDMYAELLLFHEVGHHIDWCSKHLRSSPKLKLSEEFADQYAFERTSLRATTYRGVSQAGNNPAL